MHKITVFAMAASLFGAPLCDAHAGSNTGGVFGFQSSNGTFRPMLAERPRSKAQAQPTIFGGHLVGNFTIFLSPASNIAPTTPVLCGLQANLFGTDTTGASDFVSETVQVAATVSGSTATCQVAIPYYWTLSVPTFDNVTITGSATAVDTNGNGRTNSFQLETIAFPATGTTTTITYSGRL